MVPSTDVRFTPRSRRREKNCSRQIAIGFQSGASLDTPLVAPSQHMKLRQHGRSKPTVRRNLADEPSEPGEQIVDLSFVRKWPAGVLQWRGIANLQIDWQCRIARGDDPRIAVIGIIEYHDLQHTVWSLLCGAETGVQCTVGPKISLMSMPSFMVDIRPRCPAPRSPVPPPPPASALCTSRTAIG